MVSTPTVTPTSAEETAKPASKAFQRPDTWSRWVILVLCLGVVLLSLALSVGEKREQVILPLFNRPLPPLCQLKMLTGIDCPGCGLTRSFIALAHGQFTESYRFNPAGPIWFAFIALQIPYQALQIHRIRRGQRPFDLMWWGQATIYFALTALIAQWVLRQLGWL